MARTFRSALWSVDLPRGWVARVNDTCTSFFREDGVGALQVGAFKHHSRDITEQELLEISEESKHESAPLYPFRTNIFEGFTTRFLMEDLLWQYWWLRKGRLIVYAVYNCDPANAGIEDRQVYRIIMTFKPALDQMSPYARN